MKRFIRYLYEYDQGKRIRNVGFVKIEAGNEETIVNMQGKGFHSGDERKLVLYLFYEENGEIIRIQKTRLSLSAPVLSCHLTYTVDDVGKPENYSKIRGILVETESGRRIAATWDDRPVDVGRMKEFVPESLAVEVLAGREEEKFESETPEKKEYDQQEDNIVLEDKDFALPSRKITKIQRKDISKLPRCEWKLANNQFLIHGYNNYHHLILIEDGNSLKIGVPGIYHIKEAQCADMFGFGEFILADELKNIFETDEVRQNEMRQNDMQQDDMFGYWCRMVKKRMN